MFIKKFDFFRKMCYNLRQYWEVLLCNGRNVFCMTEIVLAVWSVKYATWTKIRFAITAASA